MYILPVLSLRMNKKNTTFWLLPLLFSLAVTVFSGCNNTENSVINDDDAPADAKGSLVSFGLSTSQYSEGSPVSRAAGNNEGRVVSSSTDDLGNGLEALVEVVENPVEAKTRAASNAPAGKYTILAYQGTDLKQKWEINYNGSTYTMVDGSNPEKYLAPGTYQFYVFNDKLSLENGKVITSFTNSEKEGLYVKQDVTIPNQKKYKISFVLKPSLAQVYFKIKAFSNAAFNGAMSGKLTYDTNTIPSTLALDPTTGVTTTTNNTSAGQVAVGSFTANQSNDVKSSYIVMTSPRYFLPGTDVSKLKFTFNSTAEGTDGKIYDKAVAGKVLNITNAIPGNLVAGTSYTVYATVYYKANYLFTDGTVGSLLENKSKTPIGLVVNEDKRIAVSLRNVGNYQWTTLGRNGNSKTVYSYNVSGLQQARDKYDGFEETWVGAYTIKPSGLIKANSTSFPAFYYAARYANDINGKKWYLPGVGDWYLALKYFGINDATNGYVKGGGIKHSWGGSLGYQLAEILFYQVNGDAFDDWYWTANAWNSANAAAISVLIYKSNEMVHFGGADKGAGANVRAFIKY